MKREILLRFHLREVQGNYCERGTEFQFYKIKSYGDGCTNECL